MDKNAIKKYAVWARREMIERVSQKALQYGITADEVIDASADSINGNILTANEKKQRQALIHEIDVKGYEEVMEEVAYTWFNRFSALRFMEVNGYLPSHVRVFTDEMNGFKPQIIDEAIHLEFDGLDMEKVFDYKDANNTEELYKYLLITQCNALNSILPGIFQKIEDYTELLLPDNLLRESSVIQQMIELIPEDDWRDAVQIIGWLYQYYNAEKKDEVFSALKKKVKIKKENIPAATQLFTPDWIVRYMVENSLGRLWVEGHPDKNLKNRWKYYLEETEQERVVQMQLEEIRKEYAEINPTDIKVIDPCCGSGHILAYLFDVLMQIYESYGYTSRDAVASIIKNNLFGLDIDDRAAQLAYFVVMMKARQYDRGFFSHTEQPHVYAVRESNYINSNMVEYFCNGDEQLTKTVTTICDELYDAKEYGSILPVSQQDWNILYRRFEEILDEIHMYRDIVLNDLMPLIRLAEVMAQKYNVIITNPPYMGSSNMSAKLSTFIKKNYPDSKADLFSVFIEQCSHMVCKNGYQAMITQHAWMFLSSFEKLRNKILQRNIISMAHLGARAFEEIGGEVVQTTAFVLQNSYKRNRRGIYHRLTEAPTQHEKEKMFLSGRSRYVANQCDFSIVPGSPVVYWASENILKAFDNKILYDVARPRQGMATTNNDLFLRLWYEISTFKMGIGCRDQEDAQKTGKKWFPVTKGGSFRRWYGNFEYVVNYENKGDTICKYIDNTPGVKVKSNGRIINRDMYFHEGMTWSTIASGLFGMRYVPDGFIFETKGSMCFTNKEKLLYLLGLYNSPVIQCFLQILSPTLDYHEGPLGKTPVIIKQNDSIDLLVTDNVKLSKIDWDSRELSWDFERHPLVSKTFQSGVMSNVGRIKMEDIYHYVKQDCEDRFQKLKANEEELNRIFIGIYSLQDELTPEVEGRDVTVYRYFDEKSEIPKGMGNSKYALTRRDMIVSFISYAVGCMLGRYSLNVEGLAFAGGEWDADMYHSFPADPDNIIPICDDEYFDDDIVGRFVKFVEVVFGKETLQENLKFIADALGGKGQPKEVIRNYFLNDFFKDHCKTYQKHPIYWLFDSGKKSGFKALIYMHRYQPDTIARIRTDYVHEQQSRYRTAIAEIENRIADASTSERVKLNKTLKKLQDQSEEIRIYEEKIHHLADQMISIDLDDGVKHNYEIFKDVLAKIK